MTDRLTIAAARPGMRVRCVDDKDGRWKLRAGDEYVISDVHERANCVEVEGSKYMHEAAQFIPAPATLAALLAERAPEFLAAVREWRTWLHGERVDGRVDATPQDDALLAAIEAAGILDKPAPSQPFHLTPQQFQEMWNVG